MVPAWSGRMLNSKLYSMLDSMLYSMLYRMLYSMLYSMPYGMAQASLGSPNGFKWHGSGFISEPKSLWPTPLPNDHLEATRGRGNATGGNATTRQRDDGYATSVWLGAPRMGLAAILGGIWEGGGRLRNLYMLYSMLYKL